MKRYINFLSSSVAILIGVTFYGQVGIGTTSPTASAWLDVNTNSLSNTQKKGVLYPRINLLGRDDVATIPTPATGLLVYNRATAASGENQVFAKSIYFRQPTKWEKYSNLEEILSLKKTSEYVLRSSVATTFTSTQLTALNSHVEYVPITWNTGDIVIDNPTDVEIQSDTDSNSNIIRTRILIKKAGPYQISGMISLNPNATGGTGGNSSNIIVSCQKSTDNGTSWTTFSGAALPFENGITDYVQTLTLPPVIEQLPLNTQIRFIISNPQTGTTPMGSAAGIKSNLATDITKSFRLSRIRTSAYE